MEKDAFYFPHFCNARHDRKIKRLRKELGTEGYGIFFMLLEILRDQIDFKYPMKDIDLLAEEFGTSEQKVRVTICNYQLFELDEKEQFFSPKLVLYLQPYMKMKEQRRLAGVKSGEARKLTSGEKENERPFNGCSTDDQRELNENEQSKQSKIKESKVKENKNKYGEYSHVLLTQTEYQKLQENYSNCENLIKYLDEYIEMKGYKAKSHYLAIMKWVVEAVERTQVKKEVSTMTQSQINQKKWTDELWGDDE